MLSIKDLTAASWNSLDWNLIKEPLQLFDTISFKEAIEQKNLFFQPHTIPDAIKKINLETSKIMHAQITSKTDKKLLHETFDLSEKSIATSLSQLAIAETEQLLFCTLLLTTLPGWAAEVHRQATNNPDLLIQYLALRLTLTLDLWPKAGRLIAWYKNQDNLISPNFFETIVKEEKKYISSLLHKLIRQNIPIEKKNPAAQFIFCVDVREEAFRRTLESFKNYQTYGYAGSFGLPLTVKDAQSNDSYQSCPSFVKPQHNIIKQAPSIKNISLDDQVSYAKAMLISIGLTKNFAPLIVASGHKGESKNKMYESMLHCGACDGNPGGINARIFAQILNNEAVREKLREANINIPNETVCIAAEHNTTTDEVLLWTNVQSSEVETLKKDLKTIQIKKAKRCPRSGLAGNASLIIAPRVLTKKINLHDHAFLHSYDYKLDLEGIYLQNILLGALKIALSINIRYLFSTLHNNSYKVDLTFGIPPELIYNPDQTPRHKARRLSVILYAPKKQVSAIIKRTDFLQKTFENNWAKLICIDPESGEQYLYE